MTTNAQMKYLEKVVNTELELDIQTNSRKQEYVTGRLIFSYILHKRGVRYQRIGRYLNKNHATIISLVNKAKHYLKYEPDLYNKYLICLQLFEKQNHPVFYCSKSELIKEYLSLENTYYELEKKYLQLKKS